MKTLNGTRNTTQTRRAVLNFDASPLPLPRPGDTLSEKMLNGPTEEDDAFLDVCRETLIHMIEGELALIKQQDKRPYTK